MSSPHKLSKTLAELKASGWQPVEVKEEMRRNLIRMLQKNENPFPGILGYEESVIPQIQNAILAKHDILLLGLRGQAKTRLARLTVNLLDEWMPAIEGCPLRSNPYEPLTKHARRAVEVHGDHTPIEWIHRSARYQEKLATPDVSIADLIGDVDPIKAVSQRLDLADEDVIHYGIIPRSNRGIFAINELPDLQSRIQVGLLNIMEEKDIQIRGFPVRMPLDLAIIYTANPEDYTNRGNIITPLKDRIDAQIMTHYPDDIEIGMQITAQESWSDRQGPTPVEVAPLIHRLVEQTAIEARSSDYVDRNSGVSARMPISLFETLLSVAERRAIMLGEKRAIARVHDIFSSVPAICGKVELIYKGEQEGIGNVAVHLVGRAIKTEFNRRFVPNFKPGRESKYEFPEFKQVIAWFDEGNRLDLDDSMRHEDYLQALTSVRSLEATTKKLMNPAANELGIAMEFLVDGLHHNYLLSKHFVGRKVIYSDALSSMMSD